MTRPGTENNMEPTNTPMGRAMENAPLISRLDGIACEADEYESKCVGIALSASAYKKHMEDFLHRLAGHLGCRHFRDELREDTDGLEPVTMAINMVLGSILPDEKVAREQPWSWANAAVRLATGVDLAKQHEEWLEQTRDSRRAQTANDQSLLLKHYGIAPDVLDVMAPEKRDILLRAMRGAVVRGDTFK